MKRIRDLNIALERMGLKERVILASHGRRLDLLSYSRKLLRSFFGWLSDRLLEVERTWEERRMTQRAKMMDPSWKLFGGPPPAEFKEIRIKIFSSGEVVGSIGEGGEEVIRTLDLGELNEEETRIFENFSSIFLIRFFPQGVRTGNFREGGVSRHDGIGYSLIVRYGLPPGFIRDQISNLYRRILELIVHENSHVQQRLLGSEMHFSNPEFMRERESAGGRTDLVELLHKGKKRRVREEPEEEDFFEDEDLEEEIEETPPVVLSGEEKLLAAIRLIDRYIDSAVCPEINKQQKEVAREMIAAGGDFGLFHLISLPEFLECQDKSTTLKERLKTEQGLKKTEKHHADPSTRISEWFEYFSRPHEIEAFIRGWRASLAVAGKGGGPSKNFGDLFKERFSSYLRGGSLSPQEVQDLWSKYKEVYRAFNYPDKYLGEYVP